jgi:integrase
MSLATVGFFLDKRKTDEGFGIIKIRVTHERVQRDYSTKIKLRESLFSKLNIHNNELDRRIKDPQVIEVYNLLFSTKDEVYFFEDGFITRANNIIKMLGANFTFEKFKVQLDSYGKDVENEVESLDFIYLLNMKGQSLIKKGQISHGKTFELAAKSLERFLKISTTQKTLLLTDITSTFLEDWSNFMRVYGKASQKRKNGIPESYSPATETTIAIYSRVIRIIYLEGLEKGLVKSNSNPFGTKKFSIPESANKKKALNDNELELLKKYVPESMSLEERSHDLWLFSYYGNGMNFTDILNLKKIDIDGDTFTFIRQKTKRKPVSISVRLNDKLKQIIERQGSGKNEKLIFPYLEGVKDIARKKAIVNQVIKTTNKHMNNIGEKLGIKTKINTYEARHTFATKLMRSDAPLKMIQEKLGHKKITTTEQYLGSFTKDEEDKYLDLL